ncbi:MAG: hypothetical protein ABI456_16635 [Ktedonobacteraceae bacterium]
MAVLPWLHQTESLLTVMKNPQVVERERVRRKQIVSTVLLVIVIFQLVNLPGALMSHSVMDIGTVLLGLAICAVALLFNGLGYITIVSILLIVVVDLGCGLMLLTSPMGLDVSDLPVFDVLLVSELIAVSLLPAVSVFPVALMNIIFILGIITFQHHTMDLDMVLKSNMAYNAIAQPISLQVVVAVISYLWVRSALVAIARADRAEEIAELQRREAELRQREIERKRELDDGVEHLSQVLVSAANGERSVRATLSNDSMLWRVGNALNLLLTRWRRASQTEYENQRLRAEVFRLSEELHRTKRVIQQPSRPLRRPIEPPPQ